MVRGVRGAGLTRDPAAPVTRDRGGVAAAGADAGAAHYRWDGDDLVLEILGKPGARRDGFVRVAGGRLSVRIAAVAEGGRATARLLAFLAEAFGVPRTAVALEFGAASPVKRVRVVAPARLPEGAEVSPRRS